VVPGVLEVAGSADRDERYNQAGRFWAKIFELNFAVGVVTGKSSTGSVYRSAERRSSLVFKLELSAIRQKRTERIDFPLCLGFRREHTSLVASN
jgi:hypothetical protein